MKPVVLICNKADQKEQLKGNIRKCDANYLVALGKELGNVKVDQKSCEHSNFLAKKNFALPDYERKVLYKTDMCPITGMPHNTMDQYGNKRILVNRSLCENLHEAHPVRTSFHSLKKSLWVGERKLNAHR